jgi:hypothetical protein
MTVLQAFFIHFEAYHYVIATSNRITKEK